MHRKHALSDLAYANIVQNRGEFAAYSLIATAGVIEGLKDIINSDLSSVYKDEADITLIKEALKIR